MNHSTHEVEEAKSKFKKTKFRTRLLAIPLQAIIIIFFAIRILAKDRFTQYIENNTFYSIRLDVIFVVVAVVTLILAIVATYIWRCPHCNKHFGKAKNFKHCMHCGIELED